MKERRSVRRTMVGDDLAFGPDRVVSGPLAGEINVIT